MDADKGSLLPLATPDGHHASLQRLLDQIKSHMGHVPNSTRYYLHRPEIAEAAMQLSSVLNTHPSSVLDKDLKRKLGLICSSQNGCTYCTTHQCAVLLRPAAQGEEGWNLEAADVQALISGADRGSNEMERVCLDFARAASRDPSHVPAEIHRRMKQTLTPAQIIELAAVVAKWKFFNTLHDSLNFPVDSELERFAGYMEFAR